MHVEPHVAAALKAYEELVRLNLDAWKPEVAEWLHSEEAEPALKELLEAVPCSPVMH